MKKILAIPALLALLCVLVIFKFTPEKSCEVLEVLEGDKFVLDLNHNKKTDKDEIFHLYNVDAFPLRYNEKTLQYAQKYGLNIDEVITLGYLGRKWARETLLNQTVTITSKLEKYNSEYSYRFVKAKFKDKDLAEVLLGQGLGFAYESDEYNPYHAYENRAKIKSIAQDALKLNVLVLDKNKKLYHKPNCTQTIYIKNDYIDFSPKKEVSKEFQPCKKCHEIFKPKKQQYNQDGRLANEIIKIEPTTPAASFGEIDLFLIDPNNYSRPSKLCRTSVCQALLKNINEAKTSIDFAIYGLEAQDEILNALVAAKKRGVDVRGVIDSNANDTYVYSDSHKIVKTLSPTVESTDALMHNKFFIFDSKKVLTGTMNISLTCSGGYNSNTVLIINSPDIAKVYSDEFEELFNGKFQKFKQDKSVENLALPSGIKLSIYFSPKGKAYDNGVKPLLADAQKEIYVSTFYLTHQGIIENLKAAKARGVDVKVIMDATSASQKGSKVKELRDSGILVKVENWGGKSHEKNIVIDGKYLITGSANFSQSAYTKNDENQLIITSPSLATFYRNYFLKLYASIDDKYLTKIPKAESFESKNSCYDGVDNDFDGKIDSKDEGCMKF